jgi:dGTPase
VVGPAFAIVDARWPGLDKKRRRHEALRRVFGAMVEDVIDTSRRILDESGPQTAQQVRETGYPVIRFSPEMWKKLREIRQFLFGQMYRAPSVMVKREEVTRIINDLFPLYLERTELLPKEWEEAVAQARTPARVARIVTDYIAGMTDRFAMQEHARLT